MAEDKKPFGKLEKLELPEVRNMNPNPEKSTPKVNNFDNSNKLENEAKTVNRFDNSNKLENEAKTVNSMGETPMKIGRDYIPYDSTIVTNILEGGGTTIQPPEKTPVKTTQEVNNFDNSLKLENEGKDVSVLPDTPVKTGKDVSVLSDTPTKTSIELMDMNPTPQKTATDVTPLSTLGKFENLSSFTTDGTDKTSEVDFFNNDHAPGFIKNFQGPTKYIKDSSDLDLGSELDNHNFSQTNKYMDDMNGKPFGNYPEVQSQLTSDATNPLVSNHYDDIGSLTMGHNNVTQEVNFFGGSNSYFEAISPEIPGFKQSPLLKHTLFGEENFQEGISLSNMGTLFAPLVTSGITPSILEGEPEGSNFDDGTHGGTSGQTTTQTYDPRPEFFGIPSHTLMGHQNKNLYGGSAFDDLLNVQFNPFVNDIELVQEGESPYANIASNSMMTDFTDVASLSQLYDGYVFDPREERLGVLPEGQTDIKFPNPKNTYEGTKFDDPLVDGVDGGGMFNSDSANGKYSTINKIINLPTLSQIINSGFMSQFGSNAESLTAVTMYEDTGGKLWETNDSYDAGSSPTPYTDNTMIIGNTPAGQGTIDLGGTWYYGGNPFPITNDALQDFNEANETRTITVDLEALAGTRLGFDDLGIDTLYGDGANPDSRLTYYYTNSGDRGQEPYIVVDIPDNGTDGRKTEELFNYNFTGQSARKGGVFDTDILRTSAFLESAAGQEFLTNQKKLHTMNPRNARTFNSSALTDSYESSKYLGFSKEYGDFKSALLGSRVYSYTQTLYEKTIGLPFLLGAPNGIVGDIIDTALLFPNGDFPWNTGQHGFFGNAFQVTGFFNPMGLTIKTNVSPQQISNGDVLLQNLHNMASILMPIAGIGQTAAGGMFEWANPRALQYKEGSPSWDGLTNLLNSFIDSSAKPDKPSGGSRPDTSLNEDGPYMAGSNTSEVLGKEGLTGYDRLTGITGTFENLNKVNLKPYRNLGLDGHVAPLSNYSEPEKYLDKSTYNENIPDSLGPKIRKSKFHTGIFKDKRGADSVIEQRGDFYTLLPIKSGMGIEQAYPDEKPESINKGYPLYFKDLRDNSYIFFRGYIEGLNETLTAEWAENLYMGRSESSYVYKKATRDINFTLNVFAQSKDELHMMYDKIEKLTSLVYPQYKRDRQNFDVTTSFPFGTPKSRMQPPLTKFRLGDLFGKKDRELTGFIESLTYTWPENNAWEHVSGKRVPKYVQIAVTYKVVHVEAPNMLTRFHGTNLYHNIHSLDDKKQFAIHDSFYGSSKVDEPAAEAPPAAVQGGASSEDPGASAATQ